MSAIAMIVGALSRLDTISRDVSKARASPSGLGGVQPHHYDSVGTALLWTLAQGLGSAFTPELRDAWAAAYVMLSDAIAAVARRH